MKILLACSQYPPMKTGYARVAGQLSSWFSRFGHEVDVVTEGRGCYRIGKIALLDATGKAMFNGNHDIVEVIGPTPLFSEQCVRSAKKRRLPVVYMMNAFPGLSSYYHNPASGFVDSLYKKLNLYRRIRDVDLMVFHTNDFAQYFTSHYDGPFEVIPNGLDSDVLKGHAEILPRSNNRILFVGQLRRYKGLPYLIAAIKQLRDRGRDVVLDIVGGGPDYERILVLVASLSLQNAVFLHGELSGQELDQMYRQATVFTLPSIEGESFGIVLLEAAARGVPIVASDLPGVREVVEYLGGMLVPPRDSKALARTIAKALGNSEMGPRRTTPPDMTRFLWGEIAKRHLDCYRNLLGLAPEPAPEVPGIPEDADKTKIGVVA